MKSLLLILLLTTSCSHSLFKMKVVKREKIDKNFYYRPATTKSETYSRHSWIALFLISNDYAPPEPIGELKNLCQGRDVLSEVTVDRKFTGLYPIFFSTTHRYEGKCHE